MCAFLCAECVFERSTLMEHTVIVCSIPTMPGVGGWQGSARLQHDAANAADAASADGQHAAADADGQHAKHADICRLPSPAAAGFAAAARQRPVPTGQQRPATVLQTPFASPRQSAAHVHQPAAAAAAVSLCWQEAASSRQRQAHEQQSSQRALLLLPLWPQQVQWSFGGRLQLQRKLRLSWGWKAERRKHWPCCSHCGPQGKPAQTEGCCWSYLKTTQQRETAGLQGRSLMVAGLCSYAICWRATVSLVCPTCRIPGQWQCVFVTAT